MAKEKGRGEEHVLKRLLALPLPISNPRCHVPRSLGEITCVGDEETPSTPTIGSEQIEGLWSLTEDLYRSGAHPAIQLCIRHNGRRVLHRSIGHAAGNGPDDPPDGPKIPLGLDTPINLFSASKAISAMVIHKLDEENVLRIDDRVCDYIPGFAQGDKHRITLRHVLSHRAGVPNLPPEAVDLDLLSRPEKVVEILCKTKLTSRPGRLLAYHAVTGGFILAEVVKRATGRNMRELLEEKIARPLGLRWLSYGVPPEHIGDVALNALTGYPVFPPLKQILHRAIGVSMPEVVALSNDPRFLTGIIPSANICSTADEVSIFYQCLLQSGEYGGEQVFAPRTIRHATAEQSFWELDFTLGFPIRYSLGFMLGNPRAGPLGSDNPHAFGHVGLSNVFTWADPERAISVALMTTGKAVMSPHVVPLFGLLNEIGAVFSRELADPPSVAFSDPV
jgi:CubicO group peptidase (beta-lactamase class C family)